MKEFAKKLGFFTAFLIPALVIAGVYAGSWWNYFPIVFSFVLIPIVDQWIGVDTSNTPHENAGRVGEDLYYRFITYVWAFFQVGFVIWGAYIVTAGQLTGLSEAVGFILGFSLVTGGIGITVAHELGHKRSQLERFYSKVLLMTVSYMHFYIEHNRGHHVYVATPEDPATARKGESFYLFWVRSVIGGYLHAWRLENARLQKIGLRSFSIQNQMIWFFIFPLLFCAVLTSIASYLQARFAWEVPVFFILQSVLAFTLLELVNYVEHYGIQRKELSKGKYERVNPLHSWNASHMLSNFFLFQLQRHSDHHAFASKRYQILNHYDESPQLPYGYPTMIVIAMVPPLWFSMMNERLDEWKVSAGVAAG